MKKFYVSLAMVLCVYAATAQVEEGNWMVGGTFTINTAGNSTTVTLDPTAAYFVINRLAVGGSITLSYEKFGDNKSTTFGLGPMVRYYFGKNNIKPFLHGEFGIVSERFKFPNNSNTENGISFLLAAGLAGFLNENVALEALAGYNHTKLKGFDGDGGFELRVGFQVYLHPRQAIETIKGNQ